MKNIHLLPTDKPSRLVFEQRAFIRPLLLKKEHISITKDSLGKFIHEPQHIYIASDEDIKDGDWAIQVNFEKTNTQLVHCLTDTQVRIANDKDGSFTKNKIILTTDQDLIADGVQAIDNDFLEWFVQNPSCEFVEVKKGFEDGTAWGYNFLDYKIIIPQEEPKSHIEYTNTADFTSMIYSSQEEPKSHIEYTNTADFTSMIYSSQEEPNFLEVTIKAFEKSMGLTLESEPETLEEAADNFANSKEWIDGGASNWVQFSFKKGAEWQAERMEEELREAFKQGHSSARKGSYNQITEQEDFDKWIEQFKNK